MSANPLVLTLSVQWGVLLLLASFFLLLSRSSRLAEARSWAVAWVSEAVAVGAALWLVLNLPREVLASSMPPWSHLLMAIYCIGKTLFALFLLRGSDLHFHPGRRWPLRSRTLFLLAAAWGISLGVLAPAPASILPLQWALVSLVLIVAGVRGSGGEAPGQAHWLAWILLGEGILYLGYVPLSLLQWAGYPLLKIFDYSSLFDAGADLLLALAILVAMESTRSASLARANRQLQASHEHLRQLVDHDPLTGLTNRRALRNTLDELEEGATLIYLDIDDFKRVNDRYGHAAGDDCLCRLASELRRVFRPGDGLFRVGGDEFLVVASHLGPEGASERVDHLRERMGEGRENVPPLEISAGVAKLRPGGDPQEAIRAADEAMYEDKRTERAGSAAAKVSLEESV
ncbi:MAG: GGDEF domain-containing protein [Thermoanaerobaculia bacterium]|nr:GGDEF domain-containing protein [Thermoanaerobaculia bacterium]